MIEIPPHVRGLVFDCDGTLVDTMPLHKRLWDELMAERGLEVPAGFIDAHAGQPTEAIVDLLNERLGASIDGAAFSEEKVRRFLAEADSLEAIPPVVATAERWRGELPMAVVSGGVRANVEHSLRAIGVRDWFPVVLTADDPIPPKPAPDLFLRAAELIGVDPAACHVFEDGDPGLAAAEAAGMTATDVRRLG